MGALSGKGEATRWEQSKNKGDLGYYFAHHTSHKELAPDEYQMNSPKLLSKVIYIYIYVKISTAEKCMLVG